MIYNVYVFLCMCSVAGIDFLPEAVEPLIFGPGDTMMSIVLSTVNDTTVESDESVIVTARLNGTSGMEVSSNMLMLFILSDPADSKFGDSVMYV